MSWKPESDEIERRREQAREHGGEEAVAKHHARGRLTARERIAALVDEASFREQGPIAGHSDEECRFTPANVVPYLIGDLPPRQVTVMFSSLRTIKPIGRDCIATPPPRTRPRFSRL